MVDGDADGAGVLGGHASGLDLLKGEATAETGLGRVLLGGAVDDGLQGLEGAGGDAGGTGGARETAGLLLGGLVEGKTGLEGSTGGADVLLVEVDVGDDVVVLNHLGKMLDKISIEMNSRLSEEGRKGGREYVSKRRHAVNVKRKFVLLQRCPSEIVVLLQHRSRAVFESAKAQTLASHWAEGSGLSSLGSRVHPSYCWSLAVFRTVRGHYGKAAREDGGVQARRGPQPHRKSPNSNPTSHDT